MTTRIRDYSKGKVYKIEPINGEEGDVYIGSTTKQYLSQRKTAHKADYKKWKNDKGHFITAYNLFEKYGIINCQMVLLENVNAKNKDELEAREAHYIKTIECVNKNVPQKRLPTREYNIQYRENNTEQIREQRRQYRNENEEIIKERKRLSYEQNKEYINQQQKEYRARKKAERLLQETLA